MTLKWDPKEALKDVATGRAEGPAEAYKALLSQGSVAIYESGAGHAATWGIFSHAEVEKAAIDTKTFSNVTVPPGTPRILPLMADPPEHTGYRRLINKFFAPGAIARTEGEARPIVIGFMDDMIAKGEGDFGWYAYAFSTATLCRHLRVKEDWTIYDEWSSEMERLTGSGTATPGKELPTAHFLKVVPYIQSLVNERRAKPDDDIVTGFVEGEVNGEKLDDQTIIGLVIALILAGRSTTASGLGNLVLRLARDQELQDFLRQNPDRIPDAVEECLRIDAPQQEMPRVATCDVVVGGETIKAGDSVFVNYGSANLDPERWEAPEKFDINRKQKQHFAFGRGIHQCFGAPLARMQMRLTAEELLSRTKSFELNGEIERKTWPRLSVERLPVKLVPR